MPNSQDSNTVKWYRSKIDKQLLRDLSRTNNLQAAIHTFSHFSLILATGSLCWWFFTNEYFISFWLAFFCHATVYNFLGFAGAGHEFSHYRVFSSKKLNIFFFKLCAFLTWSNPIIFLRSHKQHHRFTLHSGKDCEVVAGKYPNYIDLLLSLTFNYRTLKIISRNHFNNALGNIRGEWVDKLFPENDKNGRQEIINWSRLLISGHSFIGLFFILTENYQGILLITLAPFCAGFFTSQLAHIQHAGMPANSNDFRENSRSVIISPLLSFLYWNMHYHVEHHMYPQVPEYNLKKLNRAVSEDLPTPIIGFYNVLKILYRHPK